MLAPESAVALVNVCDEHASVIAPIEMRKARLMVTKSRKPKV
jgi:hypothetical protein